MEWEVLIRREDPRAAEVRLLPTPPEVGAVIAVEGGALRARLREGLPGTRLQTGLALTVGEVRGAVVMVVPSHFGGVYRYSLPDGRVVCTPVRERSIHSSSSRPVVHSGLPFSFGLFSHSCFLRVY